MIRVLLAEDDPIVRRALTRVLGLNRDVEIVGHATDGESATALTRELRPDALLLNVRLPVHGGIEVTRVLHAEFPALGILALVVGVRTPS